MMSIRLISSRVSRSFIARTSVQGFAARSRSGHSTPEKRSVCFRVVYGLCLVCGIDGFCCVSDLVIEFMCDVESDRVICRYGYGESRVTDTHPQRSLIELLH